MKKKSKAFLPLFILLTLFTASVLLNSCASADKTQVDDLYKDYPEYFFKKINTAISFVKAANYKNAVTEFTKNEGQGECALDFEMDAFRKQEHSSSLQKQIEDIIRNVKRSVSSYEKLQNQLSGIEKNFMASMSDGNYARALEDFTAAKARLDSFIQIRNSITKDGWTLENIFTGMKSRGEAEDASYLSYASKFILGMDTYENSGIIGAMDAQWQNLIGKFYTPTYNEIIRNCTLLAANLNEKNILAKTFDDKTNTAYSNRIKALQPVLLEIVTESSAQSFRRSDPRSSSYRTYIQSISILSVLPDKAVSLLKLGNEISLFSEKLELPEPSSEEMLAAFREGNESYTATLISLANSFTPFINTTDSVFHEKWINELSAVPAEIPHWKELFDPYRTTCSYLKKNTMDQANSILIKAGNRVQECGALMYDDDKKLYESYMAMLPGTEDPDVEKYPSRVINTINVLQQQLRNDMNSLNNASALFNSGSYIFKSNIQVLQKRIRDSSEKINSIIKDSDTMLTNARVQQRRSLSARNEMDSHYNSAVSFLEKGDIPNTRSKLTRAEETYNANLTGIALDTDIQTEAYNRLMKMKQDIVDKQKPLLYAQVRKFKTEAKNSYYAGNFEDASYYASEAQSTMVNWGKFMDSEIEPDDELEKLISLINTALNIKSGRALNPNNALYPEMSQLLSISQQYFAIGQNLIKQGNRSEGIEYLRKAKTKINDIKLVYPRNQDANILSMKIDQIIDRDQFNITFKTRYDELRKINYRQKDSQAQIGYTDLLDLYEINPTYPGLKDFIYSVELTLGLKQPPVADSSAQEAQEIAAKAQQALNAAGRDTFKLEAAKTLARQALALNANNGLALQVLDEIAMRTGAQAAVVLSALDESRYQKAVTYLQNGNIVEANATFQQIWSTPANRRSAKVLKLKSRIEGMLK